MARKVSGAARHIQPEEQELVIARTESLDKLDDYLTKA